MQPFILYPRIHTRPRVSSLIHLHLLAHRRLPVPNILHRDILANLLLLDHLLIQHRRRAPRELVVPHLALPHVGRDVVPQQLRLLLRDDAHVHIAPGPQVVEDARLDRIGGQLDGLVAREVRLPLCLEDAHGGQTAAAHRHVGQLVGGAVRVHREEVGARGVAAGDDEVGADVALVAEEVLLQHRHDGDHARLAAGRERVQFEVRGDQGCGELGVGGGAGARAPDLGRDVVQLFAVLRVQVLVSLRSPGS